VCKGSFWPPNRSALEFIFKDKDMKARHHPIEKILEDRIAILDGAMGTTIRTYGM